MLTIATFVCAGAALIFYWSVFRETSRTLGIRGYDAVVAATDPFVWSAVAPPMLRRRYILAQVCLIAAGACMVASFWDQSLLPVIVALPVLASAAFLVWKCVRHGVS